MLIINQKKPKSKLQKITKYFLLFFVFFVATVIVFGDTQWFSNSFKNLVFKGSVTNSVDNASASNESLVPPLKNEEALSMSKPQPKPQPEPIILRAESAISLQVGFGKERVVFAKDEEKKLPIASLTKLMTTLVVLQNYDLSQKVTISESAMAQEGEQGDLKAGETLLVKDLLYITLIESSNRASYALAEIIGVENFIELMNDTAQNLSLANTYFHDTTGLDWRSYSTAKDITMLTQYLFENYPLFKEIISKKEYDLYLDNGDLHHKLINTNSLLGQNNIVGGKTGWTSNAKGCFMAIQDNPTKEGYAINVVLGANDRSMEMKNMIQLIRNDKN